MGYGALTQEGFAGLRLDSDPLEVGLGGAVDLMNVDLSVPGELLARPSFQRWSAGSTGLATAIILAFERTGSFILAHGTEVKKYNADNGALTHSATMVGTIPTDCLEFDSALTSVAPTPR